MYYKIGFHAGPGGNLTGIGDYFTALAQAGVPVFFKSADNYGPIGELLRTDNPYITAVYRLSTAGQNDGYNYDVPNYAATPTVAANEHWTAIKAKLPPEFDKCVWIEPINEVDKNRADWLGHFAVDISQLATSEGYRVALFAWASGEPEEADWETEGMLAYLRLCADNPQNRSIAIHEYSYTIDTLDRDYPYLIGRFFMINDVCTRHGIGLPLILVTEFGWAYDNIPDPDTAMTHLDWAQLVYEPHDNILGASIWYLGGGFGGIAQKVNALIPLVKEKSISFTYTPPPEGNVLLNPDFEAEWNGNHRVISFFENGQVEADHDVGNIFVPDGWDAAWHKHSANFAQPEGRDARHHNPDRMRTGDKGYCLFTFHRNHDCGLMQQVAVTAGTKYEFSIWAHAWSNWHDGPHPDDPFWSEGARFDHVAIPVGGTDQDDLKNFSFSVGIDPLGGSNPFAPSVVWGEEIHIYNGFAKVPPVQAVAQGGYITVFTRSHTLWPYKHNDAYYDSAVLTAVTVTPPPPPPPDDIPPANVRHTIHLLPQDTTMAELSAVTEYLHPTRSAFTYSADVVHKLLYHAAIGSKCVVWDGFRWQNDIYAWLTARDIIYEIRSFSQLIDPPTPPQPPQSNTLLGLHGTADPGAYPNGERELFTVGKMGLIKVLSAANPVLVRDLATAIPTAPFIIRAFLSFGARVISPQQFVSDTIDDIWRTIANISPIRQTWLEIHNEPNLYDEGLGTSWATPANFNAWYLEVLSLFKMQLATNIKFIFPGLSPNPTIPNISWDNWDFVRGCSAAVNASDALGVHAYWSSEPNTIYPMSTAVQVVRSYQSLFPLKPIFITEASNNRPASSADKGAQYIQFCNNLKSIPNVAGVTYFVSSASGGFEYETWLGRGIAEIVGAR